MHNIFIPAAGDCLFVSVHHNGDWSGEAIVSWTREGQEHTVSIPGAVLCRVLKEAALDYVRNELVEKLEQLEARALGLAAHSTRLRAYLELEQLALQLDKQNDNVADPLRDAMDPIWYGLSEEERSFLNSRSKKL